MTKTIIDDVLLDASGGADSTTGTFRKERYHNVTFRLSSSDDSATDSTVSLNGVKVNDADESAYASPQTSESVANVDVSTDDLGFRFVEVDGYEDIEVQVTNNSASAVQVTLVAEGYNEP